MQTVCCVCSAYLLDSVIGVAVILEVDLSRLVERNLDVVGNGLPQWRYRNLEILGIFDRILQRVLGNHIGVHTIADVRVVLVRWNHAVNDVVRILVLNCHVPVVSARYSRYSSGIGTQRIPREAQNVAMSNNIG
jgi:hypothetical protein